MRKIFVLLVLFFNPIFIHAQNFEWAKQFGENYSDLTPICADKDSAGNLYMLGIFRGKADFNTDTNLVTFLTSNDMPDIFLVKYDIAGNLVWANRFGSDNPMNSNEQVSSLKVDHAGNIIITGYFSDSIDFDPSPNNFYLQGQTGMDFFCKYNSSGNLLWAHAVDDCTNACIDVDYQDNIYFTGTFDGTLNLTTFNGNNALTALGWNADAYIFKVNAAGNFIWAKSLSGDYSSVNAIKINKAGNVVVTGKYSGSVDFDPGPGAVMKVTQPNIYNFHITCLDSMGNYIWVQTMNCKHLYNYIGAIASDSNDNIYVAGDFSDTLIFDPGLANTTIYEPYMNDQNTFLCKYNNSGTFQWVKSFTSSGNGSIATSKYGLRVDEQNKINMTGYFDLMVDFDPDPLISTNTMPGSYTDVFLLKLGEQGDFISVDQFAVNEWNNFCNIAYPLPIFFSRDNFAGITVLGNFNSKSDFDTGPSSNILESFNSDIFVAHYTSNYNYISAHNIESNRADLISRQVLGGNHIFLFGSFQSKIDINPDPLITHYIKTANSMASFITKFDLNGNLIWAKTLGDSSFNNHCVMAGLIEDNYGNLYAVGHFRAMTDFDPGPATYFMSPIGLNDNYILKLDSNANFIWAKKFGMNNYSPIEGYDAVPFLAYDSINESLYVSGLFRENTTGDYDPSLATFNLTSSGLTDYYILKLDTSGNLVWGEAFGNMYHDRIANMKVDNSGNLIASGKFEGTVDFDPGPGVFNVSSMGPYENDFLLKLNPSGGLIYAKQYPAAIGGITIDKFNNLYCTGVFGGICNFDSLATNITLSSVGDGDAFISKLDSSGNLLNVTSFGYRGITEGRMVTLDRDQNIYIYGSYDDTTDFDPGQNSFMKIPPSDMYNEFYQNAFLLKLNNQFQFVWEYGFNANEDEVPFSGFVIDSNYNLYSAGRYHADTLYLGNGGNNPVVTKGILDAFMLKISQCPYYSDSATALGCNTYNFNNSVFTASGVYTVISGCDSIITLNLTIDTLLNNVYASNDTIFTSTGNPAYQWIDCATNLPIAGATMDYYVTNGMGGSYAVITSNANCTDTSACFNLFPLQMVEQTAGSISFYPNPANDKLTVRSKNSHMESVAVFNVQGSLMKEMRIDSNNEFIIDVSDLVPGVYILKIGASNNSYFAKFFKQ